MKVNWQFIPELLIVIYCSSFIGYVIGAIANHHSGLSLGNWASLITASSGMIVSYISFKGLGIYKAQNRHKIELDAAREIAKSGIASTLTRYGFLAHSYSHHYSTIVSQPDCSDDKKLEVVNALISLKSSIDSEAKKISCLRPTINLLANSQDVKRTFTAITDWINDIHQILHIANFELHLNSERPLDAYDGINQLLSELLWKSKNAQLKVKLENIIRGPAWKALWEQGNTYGEELIDVACNVIHKD